MSRILSDNAVKMPSFPGNVHASVPIPVFLFKIIEIQVDTLLPSVITLIGSGVDKWLTFKSRRCFDAFFGPVVHVILICTEVITLFGTKETRSSRTSKIIIHFFFSRHDFLTMQKKKERKYWVYDKYMLNRC